MAEPKIRTVTIGQFTHEHAEAIAKELTDAGIEWWYKQAGGIAQFFFRGDWGVRLFVDRARMDDVRDIVERVSAQYEA